MASLGGVASGHEETSKAALEILRSGGNAFDAAIGAFCAACVCEPVLASLGGGGFLLAKTKNELKLFDFFVQTPQQLNPDGEFTQIQANFGTTLQHFHIGMGSVATPSSINGIFHIHQLLGHMPLKEIFQPAIQMANNGVVINTFQAYVFTVIESILRHDPQCYQLYQAPDDANKLIAQDQVFYLKDFADFLENLAIEGQDLFYKGEVAKSILNLVQDKGGHLVEGDLQQYQSCLRDPLLVKHGKAQIFTNPPPSSGGLLIAFALQLLDRHGEKNKTGAFLQMLAKTMAATNQARDGIMQSPNGKLDPHMLDQYKSLIKNPWVSRGTTHISTMDNQGNIASLSLSNGEGCGYIIPGTGIMLNNMLGEEDLNPGGFHLWPKNQRMTSMLAPCILLEGNKSIAIGSGGSNRLRTAILQVILNLLDFDMDLQQAIQAPRIHYEQNSLNIEPGFSETINEQLKSIPGTHTFWREKNLFFGGTHCVQFDGKGYQAYGDPRRSGVGKIL